MKTATSQSVLATGRNACTGCGACSLICPHDAISMSWTKEGFYEPVIVSERCVGCGLCQEVCYKFKKKPAKDSRPFQNRPVIAVTNNYMDDISKVSTIGVAHRLADYYFQQGYNVCGVVYDYNSHRCVHRIARSRTDVDAFRGSKYLQSQTEDAFRSLIQSDKKSIVFGTPCQIYGLRQVIDHMGISDRFLLVDLFCAGVPSSLLWDQYLLFLKRCHGIGELTRVNFRDKSQGWHKYSICIEDTEGQVYRKNIFNDIFSAMYLRKVCLAKPCYDCEFRHAVAVSDIRLGDFWGAKYQKFDDGVQLMALLTDAGEQAWERIAGVFNHSECQEADVYESQRIGKIAPPACRKAILKSLSREEALEEIFSQFQITKFPLGGKSSEK